MKLFSTVEIANIPIHDEFNIEVYMRVNYSKDKWKCKNSKISKNDWNKKMHTLF